MKKKQLFVSSIETFWRDGSPECKIEYNIDGEVVRIIEYDKLGHLSSPGDCHNFSPHRIVDKPIKSKPGKNSMR